MARGLAITNDGSQQRKSTNSENNFAICFLLEIPLRGFPFQMKLYDKYRIPKHNKDFNIFHLKRKSPQGSLKQETYLIFQRTSFEKEIPSGKSQAGNISQTSCPTNRSPAHRPAGRPVSLAIIIIINSIHIITITITITIIIIIITITITITITSTITITITMSTIAITCTITIGEKRYCVHSRQISRPESWAGCLSVCLSSYVSICLPFWNLPI